MNIGWIKLHRKLNQSDMYKELNSVQRDVLIQCLLMANHTEKQWEWKGKICKCLPGQFKTSLEGIRRNCAPKTTTKMVRTAIKKLEKWHFLANEGAKQGRLITICNWKTYQSTSEKEGKDAGKIRADVGQDKGRIRATNKNDKKVQNEKNQKKTPEAEIPHTLTGPKFLKIWEEFKEHRGQMKKPMTPLAESKMLKKLQTHGNDTAIQMLEQSIMNGWQGIFQLNSRGYNGTKKAKHDGANSRQIGRPEDFGGTTGKIEL